MSDDLIFAVESATAILDLAGIDIPLGIQGKFYRGALVGEAHDQNDAVYIEYDESYLNDRLRQVRTPEWALMFYAANEYGLLFDRKCDELRNLWNIPEYREVKHHLLDLLLCRVCSADDSLPEKNVYAYARRRFVFVKKWRHWQFHAACRA